MPAATPTTAAPPQAAPSAPASPDALQAQGHQLLLDGQYAQAIPLLQKAVATAPHDSLTYAYALFDLARALRLSGNPQAAIPLLEQRLQIPNQTDVVAAELRLAQQAAGAAPAGGGKGPDGNGPPGQKKKGRAGGGD